MSAISLGDIGSVVFVIGVIGLWVYAGYRIVSASNRKYAAIRYVSPLLLLGLALIAYSLFVSDAAANIVLAWTVPSFVVLLGVALLIDRARNRVES